MNTFVVRVYRSTDLDEPGQSGLRGVIEEVSTGCHSTFHNVGELLSILRGEPRPDQSSDGRHRP
jgi:hypothetical protein